MTQYTYSKVINPERLAVEINEVGIDNLHHIDTSDLTVLIFFEDALSNSQKTLLDSVVVNHQATTPADVVNGVINGAIQFGQVLMREFIVQNVLLGITQRGLTGHVRKSLREVKDAVETGSLYDAVTEIKNLNPEDFDDTILTPARLLMFRNKIEEHLNVPLASSWNDDESWL